MIVIGMIVVRGPFLGAFHHSRIAKVISTGGVSNHITAIIVGIQNTARATSGFNIPHAL